MQFTLNVNGKAETVDVEPETPLLWVLRDTIGLTGTKYGCGIARCGACTIHVDGQPMKACQLQASAAVGKKITTIEGLSNDSSHPVQQAWVEIGVPQCGYCQSGQIMSAAALLARRKNPTLEPRSRPRWPTIFAVAAPISGSSRRSVAPPKSRRHREADMTNKHLSRRSFIRASVAAGGGLMLGFHMPVALAATIGPRPQSTTTAVGTEINAWIVIDKDGTVTLRIPHTEMGQGGITSVAHADRRGAQRRLVEDQDRVRRRQPASAQQQRIQGDEHARLAARAPAASASDGRRRLRARAPQAGGRARRGASTARRSRQSSACSRRATAPATYGEFAEAAAKVKLDKEPEIQTDPAKWWLLGKPRQRLDIPNKVNGSAQYAIDTRVPGMVYAAVKASPVPWGTLKSYNFDAIKDRPGVIAAVRLKAVPGKRDQPDLQDAVAVVADSWYRAKTALELLPVEWEFGDSAKASSAGYFAEGHSLMEQKGLLSGKEDPQAAEIIASAKKRVTATYERPFETHARMEPINATVHVQPDRVDVWSPTQDQSAAITPGRRPARGRSEDRLCPHHVPGRRLRRQRRRRHRGDPPGGRDLQANRPAREGDLAARGRSRAGQAAAARGRQARAPPSATTGCRPRCSPARRGSPSTGSTRSAARPPTTASTTCRTRFRIVSTSGTTPRPTSRARPIARRAPISSASWPSPSSTRWRSPAAGIRSNGA